MAEFIGPVIERMLAVLQARTPGLLGDRPAFASYGRLFTGGAGNLPAVWAMAARTQFGDEEATLHQAHQITIVFGVEAGDPEELARLAMAYMRAVHLAIEMSWPGDWADVIPGGVVMVVRIREHNYGSTWAGGGTIAKFPELDVVVEVQELRSEA